MKAFLSGSAAAVLIAVIAGFVLSGTDSSSQSAYTSDSVRPPEVSSE